MKDKIVNRSVKDKIIKKLNGVVYWESGWSTLDELKEYYKLVKDVHLSFRKFGSKEISTVYMTFNNFKDILLAEHVTKGTRIINGKKKRVWLNISPINSDRG